MRKAEFAVPSEVMAEFAEKLANQNLDNEIVGTNDDFEVLVEVEYERDQSGHARLLTEYGHQHGLHPAVHQSLIQTY